MATLNTWIHRQRTPVDPGDREKFPFDWTAFLLEREQAIDQSTFRFPAGLTSHSTDKTGRTTEVELSGFEKGNEYVITNRITTAPDGLVFERSTWVVCQER